MKIFVFGAGKVGTALAQALESAGEEVTLRPQRKGLPKKPIDAAFVILSVRDKLLAEICQELVDRRLIKKSAVVVHNSGALTAEALAIVRPACAGVAQMHPMISFASKTFVPTLLRGQCHVKGDEAAEKRARLLAKKIGLTPRTFSKVDTVGYHAAASLVANGAAALAAIGRDLLVASGVPRADATKMLGPVLRSVAENVEMLGFPAALTGPVRRGDAAAIERQAKLLAERLPAALPFFVAAGWAQIPLARSLGEAPGESFDALEAVLQNVDAGL